MPSTDGSQIPLVQHAYIRVETGPMTIFSENTFLSSYIIFDRLPDEAPIVVINRVGDQLDHHIRTGSLTVPDGVSYTFEGEFRNQQRAAQQLMVVLPITLLTISLII